MFAGLALLIEDVKKWMPVSSQLSQTSKNNMITDNTPENVQATIVTPRNTPIFQNIPLTNPVVNQQEQVHI